MRKTAQSIFFTEVHFICEALRLEVKNETHDREVKFTDVLRILRIVLHSRQGHGLSCISLVFEAFESCL